MILKLRLLSDTYLNLGKTCTIIPGCCCVMLCSREPRTEYPFGYLQKKKKKRVPVFKCTEEW